VRAAEVVESRPDGFVVRTVATIAATPAKVYDSLVKDVGRWWDPAHTYSADASNLSIDARAGGCFCEKLADQGGVQHMTVAVAMPGRMLRLVGGLGPLQDSGTSGALTFALAEKDGRTLLTMTYIVGGYLKGGLEAVAAPVDGVLATQVQRLQNYVERGSPAR
jgi:uncharacterized protein YndB with AHSA1/START domain